MALHCTISVSAISEHGLRSMSIANLLITVTLKCSCLVPIVHSALFWHCIQDQYILAQISCNIALVVWARKGESREGEEGRGGGQGFVG